MSIVIKYVALSDLRQGDLIFRIDNERWRPVVIGVFEQHADPGIVVSNPLNGNRELIPDPPATVPIYYSKAE